MNVRSHFIADVPDGVGKSKLDQSLHLIECMRHTHCRHFEILILSRLKPGGDVDSSDRPYVGFPPCDIRYLISAHGHVNSEGHKGITPDIRHNSVTIIEHICGSLIVRR